MYRPRTLHSDIGDVEILEHNEELHVFHLVIPNRDIVAHCVTRDGLTWEELPPAITTSAPNAPDDDMIRTVSVTPHNGKFYMMYAGCSRRDGGMVERICTAVSNDLCHWEKVTETAGLEACCTIYEGADLSGEGVNWRDPKPYYEDGVYYCVICARKREGAFLRKGCVALMTSRDMLHWKYEEPLFVPGAYFTVECPQIYRINSRYYLIGSIMEDGSQRYWVADDIRGPYRVAGGENLLMPPHSHYAGRLASFHGRDVFLCWTFAREDGPSPFGLRVEKNAPIRYIPALLDVETDEEGRLLLKSLEAWKQFEKGSLVLSAADMTKRICENSFASKSARGAGGRFLCESGMEMWVSPRQFSSFRWDGVFRASGYCSGLVFHVNDDGAAYQLEFYPNEMSARLVVHAKNRRRDGVAWFDYRILQTACFDSEEKDIAISLLAVGGEIEISLNGRVCFSTVSTTALQGNVGVFANCACIEMLETVITEMSVPNQLRC